MRNKRSVILQHSCMYTREGIKSLLNELGEVCSVNVIAENKYLEDKAYGMLNGLNADIFILGLQGNDRNPSMMLRFIIEWLPVFCPEAWVVIIAPIRSIGRLKDYLLGLNNVLIVLDNAASLHTLHSQLKKILLFPKNVTLYQSTVPTLTHQELNVLGYLLKGIPALEVAQKLDIHYKTVSSHKQSALHKLGIRSLHGLLSSVNNREMISQLLHNQRA